MKFQPEILAIVVHIILTVLYLIFIFSARSYLRKEHIVPLCFVPIFGPIAALLIDLLNLARLQGTRNPDLETLDLDDSILWATLKRFHEKGDLVPLEEAVLIDEIKVRRESMLETLYGDPIKYLPVLNIAKHNEDIETSHYATTTISKAQRDFQLSIQKYTREIEKHPDDTKMLDAYLEILKQYIQSGLLEENLLRNFRTLYSEVLERKLLLVKNDKNALIEKLRNAVELRNYACAFDTSRLLRRYWPEDEQTWIESLRVCVEGKDNKQLKTTLEEVQHRQIVWTEQGREQVGPWLKVTA